MPYTAFVSFCFALHLLLSLNMLSKRDNLTAYKSYRTYAISICLFFVSDILWGIFDYFKLYTPLVIDTYVYFVMMGATILFWTDFAVRFIEGNKLFAKALKVVGLCFFVAEIVLLIINLFYPVFFEINDQVEFISHTGRVVMFWTQVGLFFLVALYANIYTLATKSHNSRRHIAISLFSIVMTICIAIQMYNPYVPLYSAGSLAGVILIDVFALGDKKEQFKIAYEKTSLANEEHVEQLNEAMTIAYTDSLTGVKSRHAYVEEEKRLDALIDKGECGDFAIVVFDLNGLKIINDLYGHDAGDEYIKESVKIMTSCFPFESVYRFGGDEFVAILEGDAFSNRQKRINNFTKIIDSNIGSNNKPVVAAGMSKYQKETDNTFRAVFSRADKIMFASKEYLKEHRS